MNFLVDSKPTLPNKFLYQYTSQRGLLGIVGEKKIWATNILYLNDSAEFAHAIALVEYGLETIYEDTSFSKQDISFFDELNKNLQKLEPFETMGIYVCSFSSEPDLLSQWRGYCPDGNGFCIGFDFNSILYDRIKQQGFSLVQCIYSADLEFPQIIQHFLLGALKTFNEIPKHGNLDYRIEKALEVFDFREKFLKLATQVKHSAFSEENEWRLVSQPISINSTQIRFREGKSMLIPYVEIELNDKDGCLNIPEVCIGPTFHPALSEGSVKNLLIANGVYAYVRQTPSTPFDEPGKENDERKDIPFVHVSKAPYRIR